MACLGAKVCSSHFWDMGESSPWASLRSWDSSQPQRFCLRRKASWRSALDPEIGVGLQSHQLDAPPSAPAYHLRPRLQTGSPGRKGTWTSGRWCHLIFGAGREGRREGKAGGKRLCDAVLSDVGGLGWSTSKDLAKGQARQGSVRPTERSVILPNIKRESWAKREQNVQDDTSQAWQACLVKVLAARPIGFLNKYHRTRSDPFGPCRNTHWRGCKGLQRSTCSASK